MNEIIKKFNIEQLDRKTLNELIDMIYINDKNNIKVEFKNIWYNDKKVWGANLW